jgi:hypothetical protein
VYRWTYVVDEGFAWIAVARYSHRVEYEWLAQGVVAMGTLNVRTSCWLPQICRGNEVVEGRWKNAAEMQSRIGKREQHRGTTTKLTRASMVVAMLGNYDSQCQRPRRIELAGGAMMVEEGCAVQKSRPKKHRIPEGVVELR